MDKKKFRPPVIDALQAVKPAGIAVRSLAGISVLWEFACSKETAPLKICLIGYDKTEKGLVFMRNRITITQ
jgi:hypothetical protein